MIKLLPIAKQIIREEIEVSPAYGDSVFSTKDKAINIAGKLNKPQNYSVVQLKDGRFVRTTNNRASQFVKQGAKLLGRFLSNQEFHPTK